QLVGAQYLAGLSRQDILRLISSSRISLTWPPALGKEPMPVELRDAIFPVVLKQNEKSNNPNRDFNFATFELSGRPSSRPGIEGVIHAGIRSGSGSSSSGSNFIFPL